MDLVFKSCLLTYHDHKLPELIYFLGDLNCETCILTRAGLIGLVFGGLYPVCLAIPVNGALAAR